MEVRSAVGVGVVLLIMLRTAVVGVLPPPAQACGQPDVALTYPGTSPQAHRSHVEASPSPEAEVGETAGVEASAGSHGANIQGPIEPQSSGLEVRQLRQVPVRGAAVVLGVVLRAAVGEIVLPVTGIGVESHSVLPNSAGYPEADRSHLKSEAKSEMSSFVERSWLNIVAVLLGGEGSLHSQGLLPELLGVLQLLLVQGEPGPGRDCRQESAAKDVALHLL